MFLAKSSPKETIREHTDELLQRYEVLKNLYVKAFTLDEKDWNLLRVAIEYHDVGKADSVFQNKIRKVLNMPLIQENSSHDVQHNYLSVLAVPYRELEINKNEKKLLAQIIAYHHERKEAPIASEIIENYRQNILPSKRLVEEDMGITITEDVSGGRLNSISFNNRIRETDGELFLKYVLLKGFLHRLDHAASAHVPVELATEMNVSQYVNSFMEQKFGLDSKNPLQQFTEENQDKHIVVVAQTGMGKTEAGLLWLGDKKGFFTLPLRVSINAMYKRITEESNIGFSKKTEEYGEEATGLLHSTSLDYLYDSSTEANDVLLEKVHAQSREFANKLIISTIDQILKFPFFLSWIRKGVCNGCYRKGNH